MGVLYNGLYCRAIYLYGSGTALIPKRFGHMEAVTSLNGFHTAIFLHLCIQLNVPKFIATLKSIHKVSIVRYANFKKSSGTMLWISNIKG